MKTIRITLITASTTWILILALIISGCNTDSDSEIYWFRDPVGFFHTNDLEKAQEEIPFTIVLPTYLPEDMGLNTLKIYGPREINIGDFIHGTEVQISYISGDREIYIDEDNSGQVMYPSSEEPVFLEINRITVLQEVTGIKEGLSFDWNFNNIRYGAHFYSIDEEEAIKIVKSMIEQAE